jgi:hypothetical protein
MLKRHTVSLCIAVQAVAMHECSTARSLLCAHLHLMYTTSVVKRADRPYVYTLHSVLVHRGDAQVGHYYAYI